MCLCPSPCARPGMWAACPGARLPPSREPLALCVQVSRLLRLCHCFSRNQLYSWGHSVIERDRVKLYCVPFSAEEGIITSAVVCRHQACLWPIRSWHGPVGTTGQAGKPGTVGHHPLSRASVPLLPPFCGGVGTGLSKEQRERKG